VDCTRLSPVSFHTVTKLLASTGAVVGTYGVGTAPVGIAFDGTNIWVANSYDNTVTKIGATR
jgi:DNA-binding beta-propeller fold protein YncE